MSTYMCSNSSSFRYECFAIQHYCQCSFERVFQPFALVTHIDVAKWICVPRERNFLRKKKSAKFRLCCSWSDCNFPEIYIAFWVRFFSWRQPNPLDRLIATWQAPERDQIAHWIFAASAFASASFKIFEGISKCNLSRGPKGPVPITSDWDYEDDHCIICFTLSGNTIVTGTCWHKPARP